MERDEVLQRIRFAAEAGATVLDLSSCGMYELPAEIAIVQTLVKLDVSGNQLRHLPPELGELANLRRLVELPGALARLAHLRELDAQHNRLRRVPALASLEVLRLADNELDRLPQAIVDHLGSYRELTLAGNPLPPSILARGTDAPVPSSPPRRHG